MRRACIFVKQEPMQPMLVYSILLIAIVSAFAINSALSISGMAVSVGTEPPAVTTGECGRPCALGGGIGVKTLDGSCIPIYDYDSNMYCCINDDCPAGESCNNGMCGV